MSCMAWVRVQARIPSPGQTTSALWGLSLNTLPVAALDYFCLSTVRQFHNLSIYMRLLVIRYFFFSKYMMHHNRLPEERFVIKINFWYTVVDIQLLAKKFIPDNSFIVLRLWLYDDLFNCNQLLYWNAHTVNVLIDDIVMFLKLIKNQILWFLFFSKQPITIHYIL